MDSKQFIDALKQYASGRNITELAKILGRPRETVSYWMRKGMKNQNLMETIITGYPEIFDGYKPSDDLGAPVSKPQSKASVTLKSAIAGFQNDRAMFSQIKIEMAKRDVSGLSEILRWF